MEKRAYIGEGVSRIDAPGKVRGETKLASDLKLPGMCYGKILYSAHPRALIRKIDIESAGTLDGVIRVVTARDIVGTNLFGYDIHHRPVLVDVGEETRFVGDAIALVVGETLEIAADAINKINVEYEVLPPLACAKDSVSEEEYRVHAGTGESVYQSNPEAKGNICFQTRLIHGDVVRGFEKSAVVVESTSSTSRRETCLP